MWAYSTQTRRAQQQDADHPGGRAREVRLPERESQITWVRQRPAAPSGSRLDLAGPCQNRAREVISGEKKAKTTRFVKTSGDKRVLDQTSLARARRLAGLKGYVTNIPATCMDAAEVIASYHDLWHVEQSFRMSKTDLRARPMFHHTRDAIEAHLTIVFTALAVSREAQNRTGLAIRNLVRQLRPLRSATIAINGTQQTFPPAITTHQRKILDALNPTRHALTN